MATCQTNPGHRHIPAKPIPVPVLRWLLHEHYRELDKDSIKALGRNPLEQIEGTQR